MADLLQVRDRRRRISLDARQEPRPVRHHFRRIGLRKNRCANLIARVNNISLGGTTYPWVEPVFLTFFCCRIGTSEASKVIMQYVAAVSGKGQEIDRVKEQLLQSNPVLEGASALDTSQFYDLPITSLQSPRDRRTPQAACASVPQRCCCIDK